MGERLRAVSLHLGEPFHTAPLMPRQRFVLASGPLRELTVDVSKELAHRSLIEGPVVYPPPADHRVVLLRPFGKRHRRLARNTPAPHDLAPSLHGISAHNGQTDKMDWSASSRHRTHNAFLITFERPRSLEGDFPAEFESYGRYVRFQESWGTIMRAQYVETGHVETGHTPRE
jgi:hypothetical protein